MYVLYLHAGSNSRSFCIFKVSKTKIAPRSVLVIGGGIIGLTTAYALLLKGFDVTILDEAKDAASASKATAGIIAGSTVVPWAKKSLWLQLPKMFLSRNSPVSVSWPLPKDFLFFLSQSIKASHPSACKKSSVGLAQLGLDGYDAWQELLSDVPERRLLLKQNGCIFGYRTEEDYKADANDLALRRDFGMVIDPLSSDDIQRVFPNLINRIAFGACVRKAGHVADIVGLLDTIKSKILTHGGKFVSTKVIGLRTAQDKIFSVVSQDNHYNADIFVLGAGYGSSKLAQQIGFKVPIVPAWGASVLFKDTDIKLAKPILVLSDGIAVTPSDSGLQVSGLLQIGESCDGNKMQDRIIESARGLFGEFTFSRVEFTVGPRPLTADSLPVIGADPRYKNLYYNFGHGHWGIGQASLSAKIIADLMIGKQVSMEVSAYSPRRF